MYCRKKCVSLKNETGCPKGGGEGEAFMIRKQPATYQKLANSGVENK